MIYIGNGFSPKMLNNKKQYRITAEHIKKQQYNNEIYHADKKDIVNCIGHKTIQQNTNRIHIELDDGDTIYIIQQNNKRSTIHKQPSHQTITKFSIEVI